VSLPGGDRLVVAAGSRFEVGGAPGDRARTVMIDEGSLLLDVAPLGEGGSFEVVTPHLRAACAAPCSRWR
jgi:hypothetical protein